MVYSPLKIISDTLFKYDDVTDTYICPGNKGLKRKSFHAARSSVDYSASKKDCSSCDLRSQCTRNKDGRTIKRHLQQHVINEMRDKSCSEQAKKDIRKRQHLMERSFAQATRYGFDRARWRGLARVSIQEFLTCCIQNIQVLIKQKPKLKQAAAMAVKQESYEVSSHKPRIISLLTRYFEISLNFLRNYFRHANFYSFQSN